MQTWRRFGKTGSGEYYERGGWKEWQDDTDATQQQEEQAQCDPEVQTGLSLMQWYEFSRG